MSTFSFGLKPSDPDFPYEIETLQCVLTVPQSYPLTGKPKLQGKFKGLAFSRIAPC